MLLFFFRRCPDLEDALYKFKNVRLRRRKQAADESGCTITRATKPKEARVSDESLISLHSDPQKSRNVQSMILRDIDRDSILKLKTELLKEAT